jgi:ribosomal protein S18 acetylase RimI-like enzyme
MTERIAQPSVREVMTRIPRFRIEHGLRPELVGQLVKKSKQETILRTCPGDAAERFSDASAVERWLQKGREVYALTPNKNLAGVIWYGEKKFPLQVPGDGSSLPRHTFAIRLYDNYRGRGLAKPFMQDTLKDYMETLYYQGLTDTVNGLWLGVDVDNEPAKKLYSDFGYMRVGTIDRGGINEDIMVLSNPKITEKILGA